MRGVYLVAAELSRLGFIVSPTSRSAAGADLLVTSSSCSRVGINVLSDLAVRQIVGERLTWAEVTGKEETCQTPSIN
jgi:hypothetical protein